VGDAEWRRLQKRGETMTHIIHITPQLPPAICGVGDYATVVGARMEELCPDVRCGYVAAGHRAGEASTEGAVQRVIRGARDNAALWKAVGELARELASRNSQLVAVILHYSGYGYDPSGAPAWLAEAIERRPKSFADCRVVTFFHELYATGRPWERAFWSSGRQRAVAVRIAKASDAVLSNREQSALWLESHAGLAAGSVPHLPICSNVGESTELVPWEERKPQAVLFGGAQFKAPFLVGRGLKHTFELCRRLKISSIVEIGNPVALDTSVFAGSSITYRQAGFLPSEDVGAHFAASQLAFANYYPGYFAKSGILAAAAAYGVPPIMLRGEGASDGLALGRQIWSVDEALAVSPAVARDRLQRMSPRIFDWYRTHSTTRHAELFLTLGSLQIPLAGRFR
jgi:hypothetical protein